MAEVPTWKECVNREGYEKVDPNADIHPDARIAPGAEIDGGSRVGKDCRVDSRARILNSVIDGGAVVETAAAVQDSVVRGDVTIEAGCSIDNSRVDGSGRVGNDSTLSQIVVNDPDIGSRSEVHVSVIDRGATIGAGNNIDNAVVKTGVRTGKNCTFGPKPMTIGEGATFGDGCSAPGHKYAPPYSSWPDGSKLDERAVLRKEAEQMVFGVPDGRINKADVEGMVRVGDLEDRAAGLPNVKQPELLHDDTLIHPSAKLAAGVVTGPGKPGRHAGPLDIRIAAGAEIGAGVQLSGRVYVGESAGIGAHSKITSDARTGPAPSPVCIGARADVGEVVDISGSVSIRDGAEIGARNALHGSRGGGDHGMHATVVGPGASTGADVDLDDTHLREGADVLPGAVLKNAEVETHSIVGKDTRMYGCRTEPGEIVDSGQEIDENGKQTNGTPRRSATPVYKIAPRGRAGEGFQPTKFEGYRDGQPVGFDKTLKHYAKQAQAPKVSIDADIAPNTEFGAGARAEPHSSTWGKVRMEAGSVLRSGAEAVNHSKETLEFPPGTEVPENSRHERGHGGDERLGFIHPTAVIEPNVTVDPTAQVGEGSHVKAGSIVGPGAQIGANCTIDAVEVGKNALIQDDCRVGPGTKIGEDVSLSHGVEVGPRCTIVNAAVGPASLVGTGSQIGDPDGKMAEIGGNCIIDGGRIGAGAVVGGGCRVGVGAEVGKNAELARNTVVGNHSSIGENTVVAPGGNPRDVPEAKAGIRIDEAVRIGDNAVVGTMEPRERGKSHVTAVGRMAEVGDNVVLTESGKVPPGVTVPGDPGKRTEVGKFEIDNLAYKKESGERMLAEAAPKRENEPGRPAAAERRPGPVRV